MQKLNLEDILKNTSDLKKEKKVGYVSIIGRPNAGKSTFINSLLGEKISITSSIPQTTRRKVLAIYNDEDSQIIFLDTPGIHKSEKDFNKKINEVALNSIQDSDLIVYFIDSTREGGEEEKYIKEEIAKSNKPILKVYTKSDLKSKINISKGENTIKISSLNKNGFPELLEKIKSHLKIQTILFPEEYYTKQDIYFRISEIIREKVFLNTKEELPHSIYVGVEEIDDKEEILRIVAYIYTETESQKYIIVGKGGSLISKIGKESRLELEKVFEKKVFLALKAKSQKNWRKNEKLIKNLLG
ncbi:GTPase Era [Candidatus Gracilibacteria bacterium]|nr:MAG: GTPase Era [Candidatus Gracilibacteria bacterium]